MFLEYKESCSSVDLQIHGPDDGYEKKWNKNFGVLYWFCFSALQYVMRFQISDQLQHPISNRFSVKRCDSFTFMNRGLVHPHLPLPKSSLDPHFSEWNRRLWDFLQDEGPKQLPDWARIEEWSIHLSTQCGSQLKSTYWFALFNIHCGSKYFSTWLDILYVLYTVCEQYNVQFSS